jgi:hypothetical protein
MKSNLSSIDVADQVRAPAEGAGQILHHRARRLSGRRTGAPPVLFGQEPFADANAELRVYGALVGAILQCQGNPPALENYVARTLNLLQQATDANLQVAAATHLLRYGTVVGRIGVARQTLALIEPILADPDVTPLRRGLCELFVAWFYVNVPRESQAREAIERLDRLGMEQELPRLRTFQATSTKVTDAGLAHLQDLVGLEVLVLGGNDITDAGVARLAKLTGLMGLFLNSTRVTDAGLDHLRGMSRMTKLNLSKTAVTDAGVEKLKKALPFYATIIRERGP